jgi:CRP-like cAMP-binding protein
MVSVELLKRYTFFKGFGDEQIKKLADIATQESYKADFLLWKKGDPAKSLYFLEGGKVVLFMDAYRGTAMPPLWVSIDLIKRGGVMGWSSVIKPYVYTLGARCIDDTKATVFDGTKLRKLLNKDSKLAHKFMHATAKVIATRLHHTEIILVGERGLSVLDE